MPNLDESELLERRLADRIVDRVRPALFRYYAAAGTAVIAVLGLIGWNIIADLKDRARSVTEQAIKPVIDDANLRLSKHATEVEKQLGISEWLSSRARASAEKVDVQLEQLGPKAKLLEEIGSRLSEIEQRRRELEENIKRASIQANGTVEISRQVADLALQVEGLSQRLESLSAGPRANTPAVTTAQAAIKNIAGAAESTHAKVVMASSEPTVWLQFAGGTRAQAEELSQALAAKRYILPGEERTPGAAGRREIRYFHPDDLEAAKRLVADVTSALRSLGYNQTSQPEVRDLTRYEGKKPKPGTLELWLELPPR